MVLLLLMGQGLVGQVLGGSDIQNDWAARRALGDQPHRRSLAMAAAASPPADRSPTATQSAAWLPERPAVIATRRAPKRQRHATSTHRWRLRRRRLFI